MLGITLIIFALTPWEADVPMTPSSMPTPRVSEVLLLIGVALFAAGLAVWTIGLRSLDGSPRIVDAAARSHWVAIRDRAPHASLLSIGGSEALTAPTTTDDRRLGSVPQHPERLFSGNSLGNLPGGTMEQVAARSSTEWYLATLVNGGTSGYLARSANAQRGARWYRSLMGWEDASGYTTVEGNRAAQLHATTEVRPGIGTRFIAEHSGARGSKNTR